MNGGPDKAATQNTTPDTSNVLESWEPSAWFRGELDRAAATIRAVVPDDGRVVTTVMAPLGRGARPGSREDRTCDRCRKYVPPTRRNQAPRFFVGAIPIELSKAIRGIVTYGLCVHCVALEGFTPDLRRVTP
jgi:hypothetical protein